MKKRFLKFLLAVCLIGGFALSAVRVSAASVNDSSIALRDGLKNRQSTITVYHTTDSEDHAEVVNEIIAKALEHTGNGTEGDYIKFHLMSDLTGRVVNTTFENGKYTLEIKFSARYLSTADQEQSLNELLNSFYV